MVFGGWFAFKALITSCLVAGSGAGAPPGGAPSGTTSPAPVARTVPASARVVPGSEQAATVVLLVRIVNGGEQALGSPRITVHAPLRLPHQTITGLAVEGSPERLTDRWGAAVLVYRRKDLAPHAVMTGRWTAWATIRQFQWDLGKAGDSGVAALSAEEQQLYTRDSKYFALSDPAIRSAAEEASKGRSGRVEAVEGFFSLVMDRLSYDLDGRWDAAPQVLARGKGSCSEYSYLFMALCRSQAIPSRYVGGIVGRPQGPFHLDKVFHRFPQVYLSGTGWVDFDPTRTDRSKDKRLYFGRTPGPMLLTCVGDGDEGSMTGWDYLESHGWEGRNAKASAMRMAWWFPQPSPEVRGRVESFAGQAASTPPEKRPALVDQALAIGHPFVLPWLDDLLYEPATRVAAARACLKIGGKGEVAAVVSCLGRLGDEAGDGEIGRLLDETTGQQLGADRRRWEAWLRGQPSGSSKPPEKTR